MLSAGTALASSRKPLCGVFGHVLPAGVTALLSPGLVRLFTEEFFITSFS